MEHPVALRDESVNDLLAALRRRARSGTRDGGGVMGGRPYSRGGPTIKRCVRCAAEFIVGGAGRSGHKRKFCTYSCFMTHSWANGRQRWIKSSIAPVEKPSVIDIAWAAGIFEGEGSISGSIGLGVHVVQKDRWLLDRFARLFGGSVSRRASENPRSGQPLEVHHWRLSGVRAHGFALTVFSFLSPRRRAQVRRAFVAVGL